MAIATYSYSYDTKTILEMFLSKNYIQKKFDTTGARNIDFLEFGEKDGKFIIKTKRDITAEIPGFAKKFIKPTSTITQTEKWDINNEELKTGTVEVTSTGLPVVMTGDLRIEPTEEGCKNTLEYEIKVNIPLIGGKLAKFLDDEGRKNAEKEYEFALNYLKKI